MKVTNEITKNFINSKDLNLNFLAEKPLPINQVDKINIINTPMIIPGENKEPNCLPASINSLPAPTSKRNPIIILNVFKVLIFY